MGTVPRSSGIRTLVPPAIGRSAPPSRTRVTSPRSSLPRRSISVVAVIGANVSGVATTRSMRGRRSGLTSMSRSRTGSGTILSKSGSIRTTEAWYAIDSAYGVWKNTDQSFESSSRFIGSGDELHAIDLVVQVRVGEGWEIRGVGRRGRLDAGDELVGDDGLAVQRPDDAAQQPLRLELVLGPGEREQVVEIDGGHRPLEDVAARRSGRKVAVPQRRIGDHLVEIDVDGRIAGSVRRSLGSIGRHGRARHVGPCGCLDEPVQGRGHGRDGEVVAHRRVPCPKVVLEGRCIGRRHGFATGWFGGRGHGSDLDPTDRDVDDRTGLAACVAVEPGRRSVGDGEAAGQRILQRLGGSDRRPIRAAIGCRVLVIRQALRGNRWNRDRLLRSGDVPGRRRWRVLLDGLGAVGRSRHRHGRRPRWLAGDRLRDGGSGKGSRRLGAAWRCRGFGCQFGPRGRFGGICLRRRPRPAAHRAGRAWLDRRRRFVRRLRWRARRLSRDLRTAGRRRRLDPRQPPRAGLGGPAAGRTMASSSRAGRATGRSPISRAGRSAREGSNRPAFRGRSPLPASSARSTNRPRASLTACYSAARPMYSRRRHGESRSTSPSRQPYAAASSATSRASRRADATTSSHRYDGTSIGVSQA